MVESNNAINNTVGASISGVTNTLTVTNASNTASSAARTTITVGGGTSGDPTLNFNVSGASDFEMGIDNSSSDSFKLSVGTALGTNDTFVMTTAGERTMPLQPAFLAFLPSNDANVTGDITVFQIGSSTALTEVYDQNSDFNTNGTFTAPVTGKYAFISSIYVISLSSANTVNCLLRITTSNRTYANYNNNFWVSAASTGGNFGVGHSLSTFADMDAGDTSTTAVQVGGGAKTVGVFGDATPTTYFCGYLIV